VPELLITRFFIWQPFTYMFLHSTDGVTHILFNMLLLWWLGSELEQQWGKRFFALYYFVCGVGAAILYTITVLAFSLATERIQPLFMPVVGASGAIFGLMLAYGIIFGERTVYFFFVFPMKAKIFVMILGGVEIVMLLNNGIGGGQTANLAHLGGLLAGFIFLITWTRIQRRQSKGGRGKLKLIVNNDKNQPKYWN
jgi:membrane associated rhomboid family serine protease